MKTFVDVGPLLQLLSSFDHQIVYGRRGTGKTHALTFLADRREAQGDVVAYVDLRNMGSSGGIYSDRSRGIPERATHLLVDALAAIHERLYEFFVDRASGVDLSQAGLALDELAGALTEVRVVGPVESSSEQVSEASRQSAFEGRVDLSGSATGLGVGFSESQERRQESREGLRRTGVEQLYVNFGSTGAAFRSLASVVEGGRIWILLDEWSSVPIEIQPYLADLLRRSIFSAPGVTVKIAAIEQRGRFQIPLSGGDYIGIELGADAAADVNLDDFMVFDNDADKAKEFFRALLFQHYSAVESEHEKVVSDRELVKEGFTDIRAFEEFVRASEGVPRDAINILVAAAQKAGDDPVSVQDVRIAARNWYQRDKDTAVSAHAEAHKLLHWIIDEVIGERRARAFLLRSNISHELIERLYDARVLHVLKRGVSTHDQPGKRYDVYKLDYGSYVDLITTVKAPQGLLAGDEGEFVDVPPDDYRSIRRAILDLETFDKTRGNRAQIAAREGGDG